MAFEDKSLRGQKKKGIFSQMQDVSNESIFRNYMSLYVECKRLG